MLYLTGGVIAQPQSTRSFTNSSTGSDPFTVTYDGENITIDLSAIQNETVYRATLDLYVRPERYFEIQPDYFVSDASNTPYIVQAADGGTLELLPPRYLTFDATTAVQEAIESGSVTFTLQQTPQGVGPVISLDVMSSAPPPTAISQVAELSAYHQDGSTMLVFEEVTPFVTSPTWTRTEYLNTVYDELMHDIAPKHRYRIYRSETPILSAEDLIQAELIDEIMPLSGWNYLGNSDNDVIYPFPKAEMTFAEPTEGIYVHRYTGEAAVENVWYFVSYSLNGAESFTSLQEGQNLSAVEEESAGSGLTLQWREEEFPNGWYFWADRHPTMYSVVRWESPPYWNVPSKGFNYQIGIPAEEAQVDEPMLEIAPHAFGGNYTSPNPWHSYWDGGILLMQNHIYYNSYTAFSECATTLRSWSEGSVQPYYQARTSAMAIDYVADRFNIDSTRIILTGGSMGGAAGHFWGMRSNDFFAYILSEVGNNIPDSDPCCVWEFENWGAYGRVNWQLPFSNTQMERFGHSLVNPEDGVSVWDYYDNTIWLTQHPEQDTPFISFSNSTDDPAIGWDEAWQNAQVVHDSKRPHAFFWGAQGHSYPLGWIDIGIRSNESLPAFSNTTIDDDLGATSSNMEESGQRNQWLRWDPSTILDEGNLYGIDLSLASDAPAASCLTDVTLRRLQQFDVVPMAVYDWSLLDASDNELFSGQTFADEHGLLTVSSLEITQDTRRLVIEPGVVGVSESLIHTDFRAFPVPFVDRLILTGDQAREIQRILFHDLNGRFLFAAKAADANPVEEQRLTLDLSGFPDYTGIVVATVEMTSGVCRLRLMKTN